MKLHFHLDPASRTGRRHMCVQTGSPQQVREAWAEVSPHNMSPERAQVLERTQDRYPAQVTYDLFATTERSIPSDSLSLAAPLVSGDVQGENSALPSFRRSPTSSYINPVSNDVPDSYLNFAPNTPSIPSKTELLRMFGIELCLGPMGLRTWCAGSTTSAAEQSAEQSLRPGGR